MAVNYSLNSTPIGNPCKNKQCRACGLYINQYPLFAEQTAAQVFWVGLSAVQIGAGEEGLPLAENTRTGNLIHEIERPFVGNITFYKTNLVKCVPLKEGKIRYPSTTEMGRCFPNLETELQELKPSIVFLLGKQVSTYVVRSKGKTEISLNEDFKYKSLYLDGTHYVPVHHPSYILVYKRKAIKQYIKGIRKVFINHLISQKCM
jgi:uracil-DNA glycosylase